MSVPLPQRVPQDQALMALPAGESCLQEEVDALHRRLQQSEELQRRILEAVPGGVVTVGPDGSIGHANAEAQRFLSLSWDELSRRFVRDWEPETVWEDGSPCPAAEYPVSKCLATGLPQPPATIGVRRPDGAISWAIFTAVPEPGSGEKPGAIVTFLDITARRAAEDRLRDSEQFHRAIAELTSDYAYRCVVDPDGTVRTVFFTDGFTRITGYTLEELNARGGWPTLFHPEDAPGIWQRLPRLLGGKRDMHEVRVLTRTGETRWIRYSAQPITEPRSNRVVGLVGAVQDITRDRQAAARLRALSRRLLEVQEQERRHLARELHDEVGQALTGLKLSLEMESRLPPGERRTAVEEAKRLTQELIGRVRELSLDLRPSLLDDQGLVPALRSHVQRYAAQTGVRVGIETTGVQGRLPAEVETAAYRIAQEALTNVARHSGATEAKLRVWRAAASLFVRVEDGGSGFDPQAVEGTGTTGGLSGMRERALLLGGRLTVEARPGGGACLTAELPLPAEAERRDDPRQA